MIGFENRPMNEIRVPENVRRPGTTQVIDRDAAGNWILRRLEVIHTGIVKILKLLVGDADARYGEIILPKLEMLFAQLVITDGNDVIQNFRIHVALTVVRDQK